MQEQIQEGFSFSQSIYYEIGKFKRILKVRVIENIDLIENYSRYAIRLELAPSKKDYSFYVNIPAEEAEQLSFSMKSIVEKHTLKSPKDYTEFLFTSSEGFIAGAFWFKKDKQWFMYVKLTNEEESQLILNKADFQKLLVLIDKAREIFA